MKISVKVIPNARQERIVAEDSRIKVYLTVPPLDGKANKALVRILSKYYNVNVSKVQILKGVKSREKLLEIDV